MYATDLTISVVIPVHNGGEDFRTCLKALAAARPGPDEVVVVADGDTDGSWQVAEAAGARVIRLPQAGGPAKARNLGAREAGSDIVFFVDADVAIAPDAIGEIKQAFTQQPDLAAIFGSYDDQPAAPNFLSQYKNLIHHYVHQTGAEEAYTFWSGCGAIKREIFLQMDGFDIGYPHPCIEDIELGYRLRKAGYRIRLRKTLQGKHLKVWSASSLVKTDFFRRALPWTELILRDRDVANDLNLDGSSRASVVSVYLLLAVLLLAVMTGVAGLWWWPVFLALASILSLILLRLNSHVYRFFWAKRGLGFALGVIPWHWFYYFYGGLAFAIGLALYFGRKMGWTRLSYLPADA